MGITFDAAGNRDRPDTEKVDTDNLFFCFFRGPRMNEPPFSDCSCFALPTGMEDWLFYINPKRESFLSWVSFCKFQTP